MFSYRMNNIVSIIYLQFIMVFVQSTKNGWDDQCGEFWWRNCEGNYYNDSVTILELLYFASKLSFMLLKQLST